MTLFLFSLFFILLGLGVPISIALGVTTIWSINNFTKVSLVIAPKIMFGAVDSFPLMAIPFFVLAGNVMSSGGISRRLVNFASSLVGTITGGLAHVSIFASMFFAAISGSSPATTAAIGAVMVPEMNKKGYDNSFSAAVVAAAGTVGVIIPPSIPMVLYAVLAGVSIGKLFLTGFGPGILMGLTMMVVAYFISKQRGYSGSEKVNLMGKIRAFKDSFFALLMPFIILGGIYGGIFTPTEAAAVAVVYGVLVGLFVYRELKVKQIPEIIFNSAVSSAVIMFLIACANLFGWLLVREMIPQQIAKTVLVLTKNPYIIMFIINIFLLILGTLINTTAAVVLVTPILVPILDQVGIDRLFMGIVMVVNLAVGMITPPVGLCLFVACNLAKISLDELSKAIFPFMIALILLIFVIAYVPSISMTLPNLLMR
ncbi:MAG TPA: TRAP transporter large permease [Atribacterota bacterium]|nr:TRAP transporter large permease [Atribacterota bacterium]HOR41987.1 TRAP transporter large permease [Atribacterota bacterium]HPK86458.1 TRAP transporter large permease [Atribacterota bacterium]